MVTEYQNITKRSQRSDPSFPESPRKNTVCASKSTVPPDHHMQPRASASQEHLQPEITLNQNIIYDLLITNQNIIISPPSPWNPQKGNKLQHPHLNHQANPTAEYLHGDRSPASSMNQDRANPSDRRDLRITLRATDGGLAGDAGRAAGTTGSASGGWNLHPRWRDAIAARERARRRETKGRRA